MAQATRPFSTATSNFFNAFNAISDRRLQQRQLEIQEAIADRRISVQEGNLLLKQDQLENQQTSQQGIQDVLTQQLRGGQQDQAGTSQVTPGELAITPGGSIGVQPSRLKPLTQSVQDKQRDLSLNLLGFGKAGRDALSSISGIFDAENEQAALQAKQDVEDTQIFALKLDRAKTRQAKNKLIEDQQSQQILDTGQIDQELLRMRNMSDDELEGEIISDLAIGENLKKFVDNRLNPPAATAGAIGKPSPKDFTPESLAAFDKSGKFTDLVAVERAPDRRGRDQFSRGTSFQGRNAAGKNVLFTPILDKFSGELTVQEDVLPGQLISRIGETPAQTQQRAIETAGGTTTAKGISARLNTQINDGIVAAEGLATINRSIELIESESVKTGGFAGLLIRAQQAVGIEGADAAELSANLARTVLSQLRPTFGAAFTEREGAKLERIEAGIGKSVKGNLRVLKQLKVIIEREARRGISAAKESNDTFSAEEIDKLMKFRISTPGATPPATKNPFSEMTLDELLAVQ